MTDVNCFDFEQIVSKLNKDPLASGNNRFAIDDRFYVLKRDDNDNGVAIIAFLPDKNMNTFANMYKINSTFTNASGQKRFVSEFSPSTIGLPDPFKEKFDYYKNIGDNDNARIFAPTRKFIGNILVLKDPAKPENEGKVFLFEFGRKIFDKINAALNPSQQEIALGAVRKEVYNPLKGIKFKLHAKRGANTFIDYDSSEFIDDSANPVFKDVDTAMKFINEKCYDLKIFENPSEYKTYEELKERLEWASFGQFGNSNTAGSSGGVSESVSTVEVNLNTSTNSIPPIQEINDSPVQPTQSTQSAQSAQPGSGVGSSQSIDDILNGLI